MCISMNDFVTWLQHQMETRGLTQSELARAHIIASPVTNWGL